MMYLVTATVTRKSKDEHGTEWVSTRQVPTFLLDSDIQGIPSGDAAAKVAYNLLETVAGEGVELHVAVSVYERMEHVTP